MPGVFVLNDTNTLVSLEAAHFASEDDFQVLLAKFPELLAGDQIDPSNPRRWVLVRREAAIPSEENGGGRWPLDHLFLDQDGVPTLAEVKRQTDTRIRREVVGQMLDYAANCVVTGPSIASKWILKPPAKEMERPRQKHSPACYVQSPTLMTFGSA